MIKPIENFTPSQKICLEKLKIFLAKPVSTKDINTRVFRVTGKAGVGKTTIIKYALQKELNEDFNTIDKNEPAFDIFNLPNVMGVALSHKAKNVLSNSIHLCKTFAATFGLQQSYGLHGEITFIKPPRNEFKTIPCELPLKAFIHDECSMYDQLMLNHVLNDTNSISKIIFMGDAGQLPPISSENDRDSPTFELNLSEDNQHELLERVRQTDKNPILELSDIVYEEIFGTQDINKVLDSFKYDKIVNGCGHVALNYGDFLNDYKNISNDYTDTKVVAYRNERVRNFNDSIRNYIYNKPDKMFIPNEIIYMNDTFTKEKTKNGKQTREYTCYNSDEYLIDNVTEDIVDSLKCYILNINTKGHKHLIDNELVTIPIVMQSSITEYNRKCSTLAHYAKTADFKFKSLKWKNFYDFKNKFGDVAYGYCYTGHKIQGSGYKNIYVDVNDIVTVGPISNKRKLQAIYTAMTRATDLVKFLKQR